jgi:hypothetical protein
MVKTVNTVNTVNTVDTVNIVNAVDIIAMANILSAPTERNQRSRPVGLGLNVLHIVCSEVHATLSLLVRAPRSPRRPVSISLLLKPAPAVPPSWILIFLLTSIASASQTSPVPQ